MDMTHYMELLASNQPWNLLLFMAIPVVLAETVAISELYLLFSRRYAGPVRSVNRAASIAGGLYFAVVFMYLVSNAVVPITRAGEWRGPADVLAVGFYLSGVVPLLGLALLDLKLVARGAPEERRIKLHAFWVGVFLVVAHIAMIFGMMDPKILATKAGGHADDSHIMQMK
jgi:hypothetical protein